MSRTYLPCQILDESCKDYFINEITEIQKFLKQKVGDTNQLIPLIDCGQRKQVHPGIP